MIQPRLKSWSAILAPLVVTLLLGVIPLRAQPDLAIVGGTIIDVAHFGQSTADRTGQTILVTGGQITAVGPSAQITIPDGYQIIRAQGRYLTPGLIDGFAVLNNQAYAQAYLAMGVTTIVGVGGGRRGPLFLTADPAPEVYRLEDVGYETASDQALLDRLQDVAAGGARVVLLMYRLTPDQLRLLNRRAHQLGLATIGELARAPYAAGLDCGVDAFVHTTRYSLGMAPPELVSGVISEPFSDQLDSPKWTYYRWLSHLGPDSPEIERYARQLASAKTFLLPTAGLLYLHQPQARNPWSYPVAQLLDSRDIDHPADKITGQAPWAPDQIQAYRALARATEIIEQANRAAGCRYLAGSGTDVWGTMPGISLHTELAALVRWGLTPREALAAATSNFAAAYRWPEVGAVQPGCRADILILDADPRLAVENLQQIETVIARGVVMQPEKLMRAPGSSGN